MSETRRIGIIGGGPAGIAMALRLRQHGFDEVTVVEAGDYAADKIGETLQPPCERLLRQLGLWESFRDDRHWAASLTGAAWGRPDVQFNDFIYRPVGYGWHLNRAKFERTMARVAEQRGIVVRRNTRFCRAARQAGGWQLEIREADGSAEALDCRFVVDASGRKAVFARAQGARPLQFDELFGCYQFFHVPEQLRAAAGHTLVESVPHGWWYSARLPDCRFVAALMADGETVRARRLHQEAGLQQALSESVHTAARLRSLRPLGQPVVTAATSCVLDSLHGEDWLAVGDTAIAFDPLSSMGIYQAIQGGIAAGDALREHVQGNLRALARYADALRTAYSQYLDTRCHFYRLENRWSQQSFWAHRHQRTTLPAPLALAATVAP